MDNVKMKNLFWSVTAVYLNGPHFDAQELAESGLTFLSILTSALTGKLLWIGGVDRLFHLQFINVTPVAATFGFVRGTWFGVKGGNPTHSSKLL
tara:strand:+ start:260 stop:541 length:282 start_codon:yes stop_codon:yes gene_type:complete